MRKGRPVRVVKESVKRLKQLRLEKGLSHETLAEKAGVSRPAISHIEAGKRLPSLLVALSAAQALEIELSEVLSKVEARIPR